MPSRMTAVALALDFLLRVHAALDAAGGLKSGILGGLDRHGQALASVQGVCWS
jgi:hypothetical protein